MSRVRYVGHGVEIEDDAVRLSRHKVEFDGDAAGSSGRMGLPPWKAPGLVSGMSAKLAPWRSRRAARC